MTTLLENLKLMGILAILFTISCSTNVLLGAYYKINILKEAFSKQKLISGLFKGGIILLSGFFITVAISFLPNVLIEMDILVDEALLEGINITAVCGVVATSIIRYLKDALTKFFAILSHVNVDTEEK